jgi:hypothetical protein
MNKLLPLVQMRACPLLQLLSALMLLLLLLLLM